MHYYEVLVADNRYHSDGALTYRYDGLLDSRTVVTVPLRNRMVTAFTVQKVAKPDFEAKPIKNILSAVALPEHCIDLAKWISAYYGTSLGESLRQFAPTKPTLRKVSPAVIPVTDQEPLQLQLDTPLTKAQRSAIKEIRQAGTHTVLLHGDTGSGKTRVYLELAEQVLKTNRSVIILTPEIALTAQLRLAIVKKLQQEPILIHSQLGSAQRKKIWLNILESTKPVIIIGPRSALFSPVPKPGLIIVDESHEPAYKQEQAPKYHTTRVASRLGELTDSRVVLGSATPSLSDYYLASEKDSVIEMPEQAITGERAQITSEIVDIKDRSNFSSSPYLSDQLIKAVKTVLADKKQALIYFNRRGTARLIMCTVCGWQMDCRNCDIPLIYHADSHRAVCHICGVKEIPPKSCPKCSNPDVIYKSIGTKALEQMVASLFPGYTVMRFDSDNQSGERIDENYPSLLAGKIDIVIGTQLLAKGFDLPRLGVVGIVSAETSLAMPDFTAEERAFQLLYQVIGRVGRGHGKGMVIVQSYDPKNPMLIAATKRDFSTFYNRALAERRQFKFPPYSYLMKLVGRRLTLKGAQTASLGLKKLLQDEGLPVEIVGPAPSFYERRGNYYYWQLIIKSKDRSHLLALARKVPSGWSIDLDPIDLL
jgi:primosomal protein N' (replication factor Y) (superfamily II helicase)